MDRLQIPLHKVIDVKTKSGLAYRVEILEEGAALFSERRLKMLFQEIAYDSMSVIDSTIKKLCKKYLTAFKTVDAYVAKNDLYKVKQMFDPDEYWVLFNVFMTRKDKLKLELLFSDPYVGKERKVAGDRNALVITYSGGIGFPMTYVFISPDLQYVKCSGSPSAASSLAALVENYFVKNRVQIKRIYAAVVECLYRDKLLVKQMMHAPSGAAINLIEKDEIGKINAPPFWILEKNKK